MDDDARKVLGAIPRVVNRISNRTIDNDLIKTLLIEERFALDVFRLFLDLSQDILANEMGARGVKGDFTSIRSKCSNDSEEIAQILADLGLANAI